MANEHYILTLDEERNSDLGFYSAALIPTSSDSKEDYGKFSWYAGPKRWYQQIDEINTKLKLVAEKKYSYDVRHGSKYFYIISEKFFKALHGLKTSFKQIIPVKYIYQHDGSELEDKFYAAIPRKFFASECLQLNCGHLSIKADFDYDLFDIKDVPIHVATLICSEKAKMKIINSKIMGIRFIPVEEVKYPPLVMSYAFDSPVSDYTPV